MLTTFWVFAIFGSLVLLIQMILLLIGAGEDTDAEVDTDIDGDLDFPIFTLKSLTGFIGGFGWGGLIVLNQGKSTPLAIGIGVGAGVILSLSVSTLLFLLSKLKNSGNLNIKNAIGKTGTVYLVIPENRKGTGIVHVVVQDSLREFKAMTKGASIPTGRRIKIVETEEDLVIVEEI
jgi:membrane-bound ClpP family serine protease